MTALYLSSTYLARYMSIFYLKLSKNHTYHSIYNNMEYWFKYFDNCTEEELMINLNNLCGKIVSLYTN